MIGGVILARAVGDKEGDAILGACRRFVHRSLDHGGERGAETDRPRVKDGG